MSSRRDYKSATTGQRRQRARRNGLLVVTLMLIGLFGGLLAYIKGSRPQPPTATAAVAPSAPAPPAAAPAAPPPKTVVAPVAEATPAKPKYDFYTELPKRQIEIHPEVAKPKSAPQPAPARMQPAVNQLHPRSTPRGNTKAATPALAATSGAKPEAKAVTTKPASAKSATIKPTASEPANSKSAATPSRSATARAATPEPANAKPTTKPSKSVTAKPVNTAAPAPTPARTTQPPRSLASNSSKIVVKTEQEP